MNCNLVNWGRAGALALAMTAVTGGAASAQTATAGAAGEWLARYNTARTLGIGGAYVADAADPLGVLWNPAGLAGMEQNEVRFENARLFEDTSINGIGFAVPGNWLPNMGVSIISLGSGDFQRTNAMNDVLGTFREGETAYLLTLARGLSPRLAVGANLKLVQQTVEDFSGGGFGIDLGGYAQLTPTIKAGVSAMNLGGPKIKLRDVEEPYATLVRGGLSARVLDGRGLIALQVDHTTGLGATFHGGAEYWLQPTIGLRVGYDDGAGTGGFSYRFAPQYQLDYAVADHALGMSQRIGVAMRFGGFFAASHAEPAVFSPTGDNAVTKFVLQSHTRARAESWNVEVMDKSGQVVRRFGGQGQPPSHLEWDGKDESGMPLADGRYHYRLSVKDAEGRQMIASQHVVEIFTTGPQGAVPVVKNQ
jgi:hypothetical protein